MASRWLRKIGNAAVDLIASEEDPSPYLSAAEAVLAGSTGANSGAWAGSTEGTPPWAEWASEAGWEIRVAARDAEVHLIHLDLPGAPPRGEADLRRSGVEIRFDYPQTIEASGEDSGESVTADARALLLLRLGGVFRLIVPLSR